MSEREGKGIGLGGGGASRQVVGAGLGRSVEGVVELALALLVDLHADVDGVSREHQEHDRQQGGDDGDDPRLVAVAACQPGLHHSTLICVLCSRVADVPSRELMSGVIRLWL